MTAGQIFLGPGKWLVRFVWSLLELDASTLPANAFWALSVFFALLFWLQAARIVVAVVRRVTGFEQGPRR